MLYSKELNFLRDVFKKNHIDTHVFTKDTPLGAVIGEAVKLSSAGALGTLGDFLGEISANTLYKTTDSFGLSFSYLSLPDSDTIPKGKEDLLFIGPYLHSPLSPSRILEACEKAGISPKQKKTFEEYCASLPIHPEGSPIFSMLESFCEIIWQKGNFTVLDSKRDGVAPASPITTMSDDDVLLSMKQMEKRYAVENELIEAVSLGQLHRLGHIVSLLSEQAFEKRVSDPLRNMKNYGIITNTLLRKAAEQGGVHPIYLDRVSSTFAIKIEQMLSPSDVRELISDMFNSYCRLVRKHSMKKYSPIVQKTIAIIDSDLSADLSLSTLARMQKVSAGYLCTVFKRETQKTLTDFIREKRIKHASYLLSTTHLQIQTVALHCGIVDVQYFSKIFKRTTGKTPKEFRDDAKNGTLTKILK